MQGSVDRTGGRASEGTAVTQVGTMRAGGSAEAMGCRGGSGERLWEAVETIEVGEGLNRRGGREREAARGKC